MIRSCFVNHPFFCVRKVGISSKHIIVSIHYSEIKLSIVY